jgi:hypothetical protein
MRKINKPILITGSHRSGSTWVGKMLSLPVSVRYVSEPFNPGYGLKIFKSWFKYIKDDDSRYSLPISRALKFRGNYHLTLPALKYFANNLCPLKKRPLVKDPIACFSSAWLAQKFDMDVVVLFRHPVAFYISLKRMDWHFDFKNLTNQPDLMIDYLHPLEDLIKKENKSFAQEAAILWLCIYHVLDIYITQNSDWIVKRHEDISNDPVGEFEDLYDKLGLEFTGRIEKKIKKHSSGGKEKSDKALNLNRVSTNISKEWTNKVSQEEIDIIKNITGDLADKYYKKEDWNE